MILSLPHNPPKGYVRWRRIISAELAKIDKHQPELRPSEIIKPFTVNNTHK